MRIQEREEIKVEETTGYVDMGMGRATSTTTTPPSSATLASEGHEYEEVRPASAAVAPRSISSGIYDSATCYVLPCKFLVFAFIYILLCVIFLVPLVMFEKKWIMNTFNVTSPDYNVTFSNRTC